MRDRFVQLASRFGGKSATAEFAVLSALTLLAFALAAEHDLLERFITWSRQHEDYELDEILILTFFSTLAAWLFATRRVLELRREMARREASDARAHHLAFHDPLTGLPNRTQFNDRLRFVLDRARRHPVALLALDLDRFKEVNDTLGHDAGDTLLRLVGERLRGTLRAGDVVARLGGDEFAIVQRGIEQPRSSARLAERVVAVLGEPFDLGGHEMRCGVSVGVALAPQDATTPEELQRAADAALYQAKRDGRSGFCFFEPGMNEVLRARRLLEWDLREALKQEDFALCYQPLYDLQDGNLIGFEALLRWHHPMRGEVPPGDFIPLAEETGLILALGEWVLRTACHEAAGWERPYKLAVNLSAVQFLQGDIAAVVSAALEDSGLAVERLEVEITESLLLQDSERVLAALSRLRELGVSIAMDDFGTGYSSLSYLWRFPFSNLKIDGSFARNLETEPRVAEIIRTIVSLGQTLNLTVTVEGIETAEQAAALTRHGCEIGQGFYLGRPLPAEALARLMPAGPASSLQPAL